MAVHLCLIGVGDNSLVHTDTSISTNETNGATSTVDGADAYSQAHQVFAAPAGAGVKLGHLTLETVYETQARFHLDDPTGFLDDQRSGIFSHTNHNLLVDGFYLRLGVDY